MISTANGFRFKSTMNVEKTSVTSVTTTTSSSGPPGPGGMRPGGGGVRPGEAWSPPRRCSVQENTVGVEASGTFAKCTGITTDTVLNLLMEDWAIVEKILPCMNKAIDSANDEIESAVEAAIGPLPAAPAAAKNSTANAKPPAAGPPAEGANTQITVSIPTSVTSAIEKELEMNVLSCIQGIGEPGTEAIQVLFQDELKTCNCVPALLQTLPPCGGWKRYEEMALQVLQLCEANPDFTVPSIVLPEDTTGEQVIIAPNTPSRTGPQGRGEGPQRPYAPGTGGGNGGANQEGYMPGRGGPPGGRAGPGGRMGPGASSASTESFNQGGMMNGGNGNGDGRPMMPPGMIILATVLGMSLIVYGGVQLYTRYRARQGRGRSEFEQYAAYRLNTTEMT